MVSLIVCARMEKPITSYENKILHVSRRGISQGIYT